MPFDGPLPAPAPNPLERLDAIDAAVLLDGAADFLASWRWTQGSVRETGLFWSRYCGIGALDRIVERAGDIPPHRRGRAHITAYRAMNDAASRRGFPCFPFFNDHPDTRLGDVRAALREAADAMRARGAG